MSRLFDKSKVYLNSAKYTFKCFSDDDMYLTKTCFDIQQSIEFVIKYLLEENAIKYPRTHDLHVLLELLPYNIKSYAIFNKIKINAAMYTKWEAEARYNDDFFVLIDDIKEAITLTDQLIKFVDDNCSQAVDYEMEKWCLDNAPDAFKNESKEFIIENMKDLYFKSKML